VAVANDQQRLFGSGFIAAARSLVADVRTAIFSGSSLLCIRSGKIAEVAFDRGLFPFCWVILSRLPGEFLTNFLRDRCAARTQPNPDNAYRSCKKRGVLAGTVLEEDWRKIDYGQFRVSAVRHKIAQGMESPFHHEDRRRAKFSPDKCCFRRDALAADRFRAVLVDHESQQSPDRNQPIRVCVLG